MLTVGSRSLQRLGSRTPLRLMRAEGLGYPPRTYVSNSGSLVYPKGPICPRFHPNVTLSLWQ